MKITFVRDDSEKSCHRSTWWAAYAGHEKAFGIVYSPALGSVARLITYKPFAVIEEHQYTLGAIFQPSEERKFLFTASGFEIEIPDDLLEMALMQNENNGSGTCIFDQCVPVEQGE